MSSFLANLSNVLGPQIEKTADYTVVITDDTGKVFSNGGVDAIVFTLPGIATGNGFTFINTADDGGALLSISPNASDGISYKGASADDTDLLNTKATQAKGDYVTLASFDGADHWQVPVSRGVWVHAS